eukprot:CAMPEP_0197827144 /NCGR_PEP_ID=MMETSP1437-20131217/3998_1 /TAXON_ID=49252 ORGANISM="Eucampia antarctica, Strain CCMP1452" /NCGR_SAMPLE_ID=MMETSP1437 /ASSEMBLY_ACC=CAM_ASM_001096 /LENGTH=135 /DNA_ID=CAMNT_0043427885 /DNA_START=170 /DNA_END=574 /DNA_ORIENTATION=+
MDEEESTSHIHGVGDELVVSLLLDEEKKELQKLFNSPSENDVGKDLVHILDTSNWYQDEVMSTTLKPILMRLAAHYLTVEKYRGKPLNGVAKFHIRNGAEMHRLNYLADLSRKGMHNSAGIMINYRYDFESMEQN